MKEAETFLLHPQMDEYFDSIPTSEHSEARKKADALEWILLRYLGDTPWLPSKIQRSSASSVDLVSAIDSAGKYYFIHMRAPSNYPQTHYEGWHKTFVRNLDRPATEVLVDSRTTSTLGQNVTEPTVALSTLLKRGSLLFAALAVISLIMWLMSEAYIISPFASIMTLIACPFFYVMGRQIKRQLDESV